MTRSNPPVETVGYLESVIPTRRLSFLADRCRNTLRRCPGNVLEVGVYRGGSLVRLAAAVRDICPAYTVVGIDTFTGHPYSDGHPVHPQGKYGDVDLETLHGGLKSSGLAAWVSLVKGRVEDLVAALHTPDLAFVHVDCDLYSPVRACGLYLPPRVKAGGMIYFDDYGHEHCPGATAAVDELFPASVIREVYMPSDETCWSAMVSMADLRAIHGAA